ncbi:MAG: EscD/YscD/HrpQ family type III secretion system periplasmic domain-containing protein [Pseudomonadota bacterium]
MAINEAAHQLVLKVLTGSQTGVEVRLDDGEYTLGSGVDDDLQFVDLSLKSGHARLRLSDGSIEVAGGAGEVTIAHQTAIQPGDDEWRTVDALDVITIGTTSLAIGPVDAAWAGLANYRPPSDQSAQSEDAKPAKAQPNRPAKSIQRTGQRSWARALIAASIAFLAIAGIGYFVIGDFSSHANKIAKGPEKTDFETVRATLDSFEFGQSIDLRQEADGVIFAKGYVDVPAERRALRNAVEETGVPARLRLFVRSSLRTQIDALIEHQQVDVTYELNEDGSVIFEGDVLDVSRADKLVASVNEEIVGISDVQSHIRTAKTYLEAVRELGKRSEIASTVLFRLDGPLIEANGVVINEKLDSWVGFVQSYARRYADKIPLRSFVQLVNENGEVLAEPNNQRPGSAVLIGDAGENASDSILNLNRLKQGSFSAEDVFMGFDSNNREPAEPVASQNPTVQTVATNGLDPTIVNTVASGEDVIGSTNSTTGDVGLASGRVRPYIFDGQGNLSQEAMDLFKQWLEERNGRNQNADGTSPYMSDMNNSMDLVTRHWGDQFDVQNASSSKSETETLIEQRFLPLIQSPTQESHSCWSGARLNHANLPSVLFWLDMLSVSSDMSLSTFDIANQHLLLEAALNPRKTAVCAELMKADVPLKKMSLYLAEARKNPDFIKFIVRNHQEFPIEIAGVMLGSDNRFIQTVDGEKVREGAAPDTGSKLANVGELGILVQLENQLATKVYNEQLAWKSDS